MARLLLVLFILLAMAGAMMIIKHAGKTYRYLPMDLEEPPKIEAFEQWREFVSAIGKFKVMLPSVPQHASEDLPVPDSEFVLKYEMYVSEEGDGTTFMISLIKYPDGIDTSKPENMLENVMNEMISVNPSNRLRSMSFFDLDNHKALDFSIASPEIVVNSRAFIVEKILYLLTVIDKVNKEDSEEYQYFIDSFQLLPLDEASNHVNQDMP